MALSKEFCCITKAKRVQTRKKKSRQTKQKKGFQKKMILHSDVDYILSAYKNPEQTHKFLYKCKGFIETRVLPET